MSNSMKLIARTLIILVLMAAGSWLNNQLDQFNSSTGQLGFLSFAAMYAVYFLIGIALGSTANPRFTKAKNKWVYFIPMILFALIGTQWFFSPLFNVSSLPFGIGAHLLQFSYLSWGLVGYFLNLSLR
ncbi:MAG: hypothetical protein K0R19_811 [Bacillota bacterium]|nr:hypothetical protein [Bacillota bacterium]